MQRYLPEKQIENQNNNVENGGSRTKIFVIAIICLATVTSIWIVNRAGGKTTALSANDTGATTISVEPRPVVSSFDSNGKSLPSWQEVLVGTDLNSQSAPTNSTEGTLTDQMSKDFFAQYLQLKQGGKTVTPAQANQIAQNTLTSPSYSKATGVVYTINDLHFNSRTNLAISQKYSDDLLQILKNHMSQQPDDAMTILGKAVQNKNPTELNKLDSLIVIYKGIISDLLVITIPSDAVGIHLALINAMSNVLDNVEAMRVTFNDPVRAFAAVSQYKQHMTDIRFATKQINDYFVSKNIVHQTIK